MDYAAIYENFKMFSNHREEQGEPFFEKATEEELRVLTVLYDVCCQNTHVWEKEELTELKQLTVPPRLAEFYQELNPANLPMNDAAIHLADLKGIQEEYTALVPGCFLIKWGFLVIATTIGGNPVIVDLNVPQMPIYITDYNLFMYDGVIGNIHLNFAFPNSVLCEEYDEASIPVNYDTIKKCLIMIERDFETFMTKLSNNTYDDLEELLDEN